MSNFEPGSPTTEFIADKHDTQIDRPSERKIEVNEGTASDDQVNTEQVRLEHSSGRMLAADFVLQLSSSSPRIASDKSSETLQSVSFPIISHFIVINEFSFRNHIMMTQSVVGLRLRVIVTQPYVNVSAMYTLSASF